EDKPVHLADRKCAVSLPACVRPLDCKRRIVMEVSPSDFQPPIFMSAALVKLQRKGQMVIPRSLREEAGVQEGTLMKVAVVKGGQFLLTTQFTIDRPIIAAPRKDSRQAFRTL